MATEDGARSLLATIVGYVIVAFVVVVVFRFVAGTFFWVIRTVVIVVIFGALVAIYLKLKSPD